MRKTVRVNWNLNYLAFRKVLSRELEGHAKRVYTRAEFAQIALASIPDNVDDSEFRRAVRALMREQQIRVVIGQKTVTLSQIQDVEWKSAPKAEPVVDAKPLMRLHTGRSLFNVLMTPTLTQKRRWYKGFSHAVMANDFVISLHTRIADDNGAELPAVVLHHSDVLLVNEPALEIIEQSAKGHNIELFVRKL